MTITAGSARTLLEQEGAHAAFPGMCALPDGRLLRVWRDAPAHTGGMNGRIFGQFMDAAMRDRGKPFLLLDWAQDLRDPSLSVSRDGSKVWLTFFSYATPSDPACRAWMMTSYDGGKSFTDAIQIGEGADSLAITSPIVEGDGEIFAFTYGKWSPTQTKDSVYVSWSADGGATWAWNILANGPADGRDYQEPWVIRLKSGALLAAMRYGAKASIAVRASADHRAWGPLVPKFPGWGRPVLIELSTGPTIMIYRDLTTNAAIYRTSPDRGGNWSWPPVVLETPGWEMSYAAPVEVAPGLVSVVLGAEESGTDGSIRGFFMVD